MRRHPDMRLTHDQWSTGDAVAAGIMFLVGLIAIVGAISLLARFATPANAHEWYPPACCWGGDCGPVEPSRIERDGVDYIIDHRWRVQRSSTQPSPDGRFHGCWPDKDKPPVCVFAPPDGM